MDYTDKNVGVTIAVAAISPQRLMDQVRGRLRLQHYSLRTEQAYTAWIRRFIVATGRRHPRELGGPEVEQFLTSLAVDGQVAAGTQNQALSALLFLYREVLASSCRGWRVSFVQSVHGGCRRYSRMPKCGVC